jgi:hypothetical protein
MFTSHEKQFVNIDNAEPPRVMTTYENVVGEESTGYYKNEKRVKIVHKVPRFGDGVNDNHIYSIFTYDEEADRYDVITKELVEDLTEKFGFAYNTDVLDSKNVGDIIDEDEIVYKSQSYDDDMNYSFGKNAVVMYTIDNWIIEDAIKARKGFCENTVSNEIETIEVPLNDNDILCNLYGDSKNHKGFPDIGERADKIVCARRRIHNSQLLYDLKKSNLRKINLSSDQLFYSNGVLVDIVIYSNKTLDELPDNEFYAQIKRYLKMQTEYYEKMFEICDDIIESGSKYSGDIGFYHRKARDILDETCGWREENGGGVFSNIKIKFTFQRKSKLSVGSKITGRYGKIAVPL